MSQGSELTILMVEDDQDSRDNLRDILQLDGHRVIMAASIQQALGQKDWNIISAVILDWKLPDGTAEALIPMLKQHVPNVPIIVVTGYPDVDGAISALRSGAYDYILKPISPDALRATLRRVGERQLHLQQIEIAEQQLVQSERLAAIGEMVAGLAHESRNAFQRSQACLEALALDLEDHPESLTLVQKIQSALDHLHHLYEEVRDYAAPINLQLQTCSLTSLIRETWQQVAVGDAASIKLALQFDQQGSAQCHIDRTRIQQVFRNLFENAIDACGQPGHVSVSLQPSHQNGRSFWTIDVHDNGPGVEASVRPNVFRPFFTTKTKGTGLGMAITRRIVETHDGTIELVDDQREGATFRIRLPQHGPTGSII